jgi:hypothetical protein
MLDIDAQIGRLARSQHGVVSTSQCRDLGMRQRQVADRVTAGVLLRPFDGVVAIAAVPATWEQRVMACVLAAGTDALASHRTAARLWGLISYRHPAVEVVMPRWERAFREFTVHESLDLIADDRQLVSGIPTTWAARTVVDLGAVAPRLVESALDTGVRKGLFALSDVKAFVDRVARRGRRGVGVIRPFLEARMKWDASTESELEDLFCRVLAEFGVRPPVAQYVLRNDADAFICRADFAYPHCKILIELDSEAHHMDRQTFRLDRAKQNQAGRLGWRTLRYTWWDLTEAPWRVADDLHALLGSTPYEQA